MESPLDEKQEAKAIQMSEMKWEFERTLSLPKPMNKKRDSYEITYLKYMGRDKHTQ